MWYGQKIDDQKLILWSQEIQKHKNLSVWKMLTNWRIIELYNYINDS